MSKKLLVLSLLSILLLITISQTSSVKAAIPVTILNKGHYIIEWISEPETVDPAWAYDASSGEIIANVYETLISFDREHVDQFVPALSTQVPSVTNGGIQFINELDPDTGIVWKERLTFPIRLTDANGQPIRFHSGNPLTMADFEYSFERWMVQDRSGGPSWMIYEPTHGIGIYHAFDYTDDPVVQGKIIDHAFQVSGTNFIINLAVPYTPILGILAQYWASILDKAYITANVPADWDGNWGAYTEWVNHHNPSESPLDKAGNVMSGTGPYAGPGPYANPEGYGMGYWFHVREWSIVKFEDYWRGWPYKEASGFFIRVTEKLVTNWLDRLRDFKAGFADTVHVPPLCRSQVIWPGIRTLYNLPSPSTYLNFRSERDWVQGWYYNPFLAVSDESASGPYYYHMWKGLNGDVNGDGHVYATDAGRINAYWYSPPYFYGPDAISEGYPGPPVYRVKYDVAPYLQHQIDMLPPPGDSVGKIDLLDKAVINAHWDEQTDP